MDAPFVPGFTRYTHAFGGYVERYVWLSFETTSKLDAQGCKPNEPFVGNDLRWHITHELAKDENGRDCIVEMPPPEKNKGDGRYLGYFLFCIQTGLTTVSHLRLDMEPTGRYSIFFEGLVKRRHFPASFS